VAVAISLPLGLCAAALRHRFGRPGVASAGSA
jgi:hypothetical protein